MSKPIPLTVNPDDPDSPKGALPVDIHGIEGGGGADIDWTDINLPEDAPMMMKYGGAPQFAMMPGVIQFASHQKGGVSVDHNGTRLDTKNGLDIQLISEGDIRLSANYGDISFTSADSGNSRITLGEILNRLEAVESLLESLENPESE